LFYLQRMFKQLDLSNHLFRKSQLLES
jgi:hypothetical protein